MSFYLHLVVFLISTFAGLDARELSWNGLNTRTVDIEVINIEKAPWQVSVQLDGDHLCGGSIWSNNIIITAANCLTYGTALNYTVRAGSSIWNSGGQLIQVADFKIHESYDNITEPTDIAVIRLAKPLKFGTAVKKISLAKDTPKNKTNAYLSGWGLYGYNSFYISNKLHGSDIKIIENTKCNFLKHMRQGIICAGLDGKDSCTSDIGGPLVSNGVLVGVAIKGTIWDGFAGVYSDVAYIHKWLVNAKNELEQTS